MATIFCPSSVFVIPDMSGGIRKWLDENDILYGPAPPGAYYKDSVTLYSDEDGMAVKLRWL